LIDLGYSTTPHGGGVVKSSRRLTVWRPPRLGLIGNATAIRNARHACKALEHLRREREEVEAFLADWRELMDRPHAVPE
jgi:hypothetical protein